MARLWSEASLQVGALALKMGLLTRSQWAMIRENGPADDGPSDDGTGEALIAVLIDRGFLSTNDAALLRLRAKRATIKSGLRPPSNMVAPGAGPLADSRAARDPDAADTAGITASGEVSRIADPRTPPKRKSTRKLAPKKAGSTGKIPPPELFESDPNVVKSFDGLMATTTIGPYELVDELARGGMGVVYRVKHIESGHIFALKVLIAGGGATEEQIRRFHREAETAATLEHPNIVGIHEVGSERNRHYFTMDFIDGDPLQVYIAKRRPRLTAIMGILRKVADALDYSHKMGVVHRDVKPGNILIDRAGEPHLTDFGLAKVVDTSQSKLTGSGIALGTPAYMSPEQAEGRLKDIDRRSDVYALGVVMYEAMTGHVPFTAETIVGYVRKIVLDDPKQPRKIVPTVPRELELICLKALEKDPARRYDSAGDMADDLGRWLRGEPVRAKPPSVRGRVQRWIRKYPSVVVGIFFVMVLLVAGIGISNELKHAENRRQQEADAAAKLERERQAAEGWAREQQRKQELERQKNAREIAARERRDKARAGLNAISGDVNQLGSRDLLRAVIDRYAAVAKLDPTWAMPLYLQGRAHHRLGEWNAAIQQYEAALKLDASLYEAHFFAAMALMWGHATPESAVDPLTPAELREWRRQRAEPHFVALGDAQSLTALGEHPKGPPSQAAMRFVGVTARTFFASRERDVARNNRILLGWIEKAKSLDALQPYAYFFEAFIRGNFVPVGTELEWLTTADVPIDAAAAIDAMKTGADLDVLNTPAQIALGRLYLKYGKLGEAKAVFERVQSLDASRTDMGYFLARIFDELEEFDKAVPVLTEALKSPQSRPAWHVYLACLLMKQGRFIEANKALETPVDDHGMDEARFLRGLCRATMGQLDGATADLKALFDSPNSMWARMAGMVDAMSSNRRALFVVGVEYFRMVFAVPPDLKGAVYRFETQRLDVYREANEFAERLAISDALRDALETVFGDPSLHRHLEDAFSRLKPGVGTERNLIEWMAPARLALKLQRENELERHTRFVSVADYYHRAAGRMRRGKLADARRDLETAVEMRGDSAILNYSLATVAAKMGDAPTAVSALRMAITAGFDQLDLTRRDPDFRPIASDPQFIELMRE